MAKGSLRSNLAIRVSLRLNSIISTSFADSTPFDPFRQNVERKDVAGESLIVTQPFKPIFTQ
jgi:hypothetical protein